MKVKIFDQYDQKSEDVINEFIAMHFVLDSGLILKENKVIIVYRDGEIGLTQKEQSEELSKQIGKHESDILMNEALIRYWSERYTRGRTKEQWRVADSNRMQLHRQVRDTRLHIEILKQLISDIETGAYDLRTQSHEEENSEKEDEQKAEKGKDGKGEA